MRCVALSVLALALSTAQARGTEVDRTVASADSSWPAITAQQKPWTRWWWPGSAVDTERLTVELEDIAAAGFGGVEITPIYGARGAESRFIPFLSPRYVGMLAHASATAKRLGLGIDMATGTGWPFGGPWVGAQDAELKLDLSQGRLDGVPTDFRVTRAAPGDEGPVLNPFSVTAMQHYLEPFTAALAGLPPGALRSQFHDSFEYTADWSNEVLARFASANGYDLRDQVRALAGEGDPDVSARVKGDYRATLAALHLDYIRTWTTWAHTRHELSRNQAHGSPGNVLDVYAAADIPETEAFGSTAFAIPGFRREESEIDGPGRPFIAHEFAASAAHVTGKRLVSSETFTWLREHFHESPSEMKPELDQLFLAGVNHIFYHGTAYSPPDAPWPGWLFYASTQANSRNPLWRDLAAVNAYIARSQSLLQSGSADNDMLLYWPVYDLWHSAPGLRAPDGIDWSIEQPFGRISQELTARGYPHDFISDDQLAAARYENGVIRTAGGQYRALLIPPTAHMPAATLRHVLDLARAGARVWFVDALPHDVEGWGHLAERRAQLQVELARAARLEIRAESLSQILSKAERYREPLVDQGLRFNRRRTADGHIYFLANLTDKPFDGWLRLRVATHTAWLMDALNGGVGTAARDSSGALHIQLAPGESLFVRIFDHRARSLPPWPYRRVAGLPLQIKGPWRLTFVAGGPTLPDPRIVATLHSWTEDADEAAQIFAGTARYETRFTVPANAKADDWWLDLGDVRETARVLVNGQDVGTIWSLPQRLRVGAYLKSGSNTVTLDVTNLAANRIRDLDRRHVPWRYFYDINFVNIHYGPFDASTWPLQPSGLLGPVRLVPAVAGTGRQ